MKKFSYSNLFLDALNLVLNYKYLWLLGLLAALSGSEVSNFRNTSDLSLSGSGSFSYLSNYFSDSARLTSSLGTNGERFLTATASTLLLGIVLWVVGSIGQIALIKAAETLNGNHGMALPEALRAGIRFLMPVIGIAAVLYGPYYGASILIGRALASSIANDLTAFPTVPFVLLLLILFPLGVFVGAVYPLAQRGVVSHGLGVIPGITAGWRFLWQNLKRLIFIVLILALLLLVYSGIVSAILLPLAGGTVFPALFTWLETGSISAGQVLSIAGFSLLGTVLSAPITAYASVVMTLAYCTLSEQAQTRLNAKRKHAAA